MEYREIEALSIEDAKFKIKKEFGDRARIIKIIESNKGGFLGFGTKKHVKVLISISDIDLLKKYKENLGLNKIARDNKIAGKIVPDVKLDIIENDNLSLNVILDKLNFIENKMLREKNIEPDANLHPNLAEVKQILKENEFFDDFIDSVLEEVKATLSYTKLDNKTEVHKFVYEFINNKILICERHKRKKKKRMSRKNRYLF